MNAQLKSLGVTPNKAALIGVLLVVFAAVWGPQLLGGRGKPVAKAAPNPSSAKPADRAPKKPDAAAEVTPAGWLQNDQPGPIEFAFALSDVAGYDPFAPPEWSPAAQRGGSRTTGGGSGLPAAARFKAIQDSGVAMILVSGGQRAAQVGDHTLRIGDQIDGFRVIEINAEGVVFEPVDETEGADLGP